MRFTIKGEEVEFENIFYIGESFIIAHLPTGLGVFIRGEVDTIDLFNVLKRHHLTPKEEDTYQSITYIRLEGENDNKASEEGASLCRRPSSSKRLQDSLSWLLEQLRPRESTKTRIT